MKLICSTQYAIPLGEHVFLTDKFFKAAQKIIEHGLLSPSDILEPGLASREDLLLVHSPVWVEKILDGKATPEDERRMELPYSQALAQAHQRAVQGGIEAARQALETGIGLHAGGGSHHAFANHGEGFCVFNDISVAIQKMRREKKIKKAAVVDLDVHQGNGTASIFTGDPDVFTFSMHQENNYPQEKPTSSLDIGLPDATSDKDYLKILRAHLPEILDSHKPELVVYQAGADVYENDQLGGLRLSLSGIQERDRVVFIECFQRRIPVMTALGGGYARDPKDTVQIHADTLRIGIECHKKYVQRN